MNRVEKRIEIEQRGYKSYIAEIHKKPPDDVEPEEYIDLLLCLEDGTYQEHFLCNNYYWGEGSSIVGYRKLNHKDTSKKDLDSIINPNHYKTIPAGNYPHGIQYMGIVAFLLQSKKDALDHYEAHIYSQIMKYSLRLGEKDKVLQDMKKVKWYVDLFILYQEVKEGHKSLQDFVSEWEIVNKKACKDGI